MCVNSLEIFGQTTNLKGRQLTSLQYIFLCFYRGTPPPFFMSTRDNLGDFAEMWPPHAKTNSLSQPVGR